MNPSQTLVFKTVLICPGFLSGLILQGAVAVFGSGLIEAGINLQEKIDGEKVNGR